MKKLLLTLISLAILLPTAWAVKPSGNISGVVKEESGDPAAFVTMVLLDADSNIVKTDYSKEDGSFTFPNIKPGQYTIQVSSLQYEGYISQKITLKEGEVLKIPSITLNSAVQQLDEVRVSATRPMVEVQPDKTVFNVEGSPNASGNDGMDLLRKSPGVIIDNNDNVILQGKNGVRIFIDGKPSQLSGEDLTAMLRSMQSEQIEAIEIITNPPAKYEAQGNAGIINIRLKRDKNLGTNASFNTGYDVHVRERYRAGITANHRTKKLSLFGNYNYYNMGGENFVDFEKELNVLHQNSEATINWHVIGHGFRGGADYYINKNHTIGFVANGNINARTIDNLNNTTIATISSPNVIDSTLVSDNISDNDTDNVNMNFNYQYKGEKGSSVNIDLDYGIFDNAGYFDQPNEYMRGTTPEVINGAYYTNTQTTRIDISTAKLDYEVSLGKGKFSTGSKYSKVVTDNGFLFYDHAVHYGPGVIDNTRSSDFTYDERVFALYANYAIKLGEKINLNAGLRMENTESLGTLTSLIQSPPPVDRSYTDLFPSGGFTYAHSKTNQFGLNYSRRIDRPSYQNLNPFEFRLDELSYREGNPFLKPQYTHNFELTHTYKYKLNTKMSYSITSDFFGQVTEALTGTNASIIRQENLADVTNFGMNISYPFNVTKWWSGYSSLNFNHATYKSDLRDQALDIDASTYNIFVQNNFMLPKGFKVELSGWYNSPSIWGGTFVTGSMYSINTGVQKSVLQGKGNLTIGLDDILHTQQWQGESDLNGLKLIGNGGRDSRRFKIGFTYRIGNQKVRARRRSTGMEEESKRIQQGNS